MGDDSALLDGAFTAGDALENTKALVQTLKCIDSHEIRGGLAVLGDENGILLGLKGSDDFGGLALEGCHEFSSHEVPL